MSDELKNMPAAEPEAASVPVEKRASRRRVGIGTQIYLGLFGSVALVSIASFVAYYFLNEIVEYQSRLAVQSIPNLSRAVEVARQSATLVNGAVRMVSATSLKEHEVVSAEVLWEREELLDVVEELGAGAALDDQVRALQSRLMSFGTLLDEVYQSSGRRLTVERTLEALSEELGELNRRIERAIATAIDDQGFFLVEGMRNLEDRAQPLARRDWGGELFYYRDLIEISQQANLAGLQMGRGPVTRRPRPARTPGRAVSERGVQPASSDCAAGVASPDRVPSSCGSPICHRGRRPMRCRGAASRCPWDEDWRSMRVSAGRDSFGGNRRVGKRRLRATPGDPRPAAPGRRRTGRGPSGIR